MKAKFKIYLLGLFLLSIFFTACNKDEMQAEDSIEGGWTITEITSLYAEFSENGFNPIETISETGNLGTFNFTEDSVEFDFMRNDTLYTGSGPWSLEAERVNAGFSRVTEFTLTIDNHFVFDVAFEDSTKNSEKNAEEATFVTDPPPGNGVLIEMSLEKN